MSGVEERGGDPRIKLDRLEAGGGAAKPFDGVERAHRLVERLVMPASLAVAMVTPGLSLVRVRRVEHHQLGEVAGGGGGNDLALKAALRQQRQSPAMVERGMGEQHRVDLFGVETEGRGVVLGDLARALEHAAIEEDFSPAAIDEMARAGDLVSGAVE